MDSTYQPDSISQFFDEFGIQEWERLVQSPMAEISLYIHSHFLKKHILKDHKVLEIGAGAGRFTQILSSLGARIVVADISSVQLDLNKRFSSQYGFDHSILDWKQVDICDLSRFETGSFDAVVAYGGPFSYVLDKRDLALFECLRVLKTGGTLLASVMSLWGTAHGFLDNVLSEPPEVNQKIISTGDITTNTNPDRKTHFMHLFRASELFTWLENAGLTVVDRSASNCLSLTWDAHLKQIRTDPNRWNELLQMELEACAEKGCQDMGTHILAVARK